MAGKVAVVWRLWATVRGGEEEAGFGPSAAAGARVARLMVHRGPRIRVCGRLQAAAMEATRSANQWRIAAPVSRQFFRQTANPRNVDVNHASEPRCRPEM